MTADGTPVWFCLSCGWRSRKDSTDGTEAIHLKSKCKWTLTIRWRRKSGAITGGDRRWRPNR